MALSARGWWLRQLHLWHWISGGASLATMLFFAVTGLVLNHPLLFPARGAVQEMTLPVPAALQPALTAAATTGTGPLPAPLAAWLTDVAREPMANRVAEFAPDEIWIDLPRPGGEGSALIDRTGNEATLTVTRRGWLAVAADLHKGRAAGPAWSLIIDAMAAGSVLFALSGLAIMALHARARPATWPVGLAGLVLPLMLFLMFVHV